jgi:flagellar assembly protein FliH
VNQANFVETPYEDATWEIVGESEATSEFVPMEIETVNVGAVNIVDPMFADYGGFPETGDSKRWHLPEHLSASMGSESEEGVEAQPDKIALTEQEIEALKAEAFAAGKLAGLEEAVQQNVEKLAEIEQRFGVVLTDMATQLGEHVARIEREAVDLALAISQKIVGFAVEINPEYIIPVVNEALKLAGGATIRKVRISPQDMEFIEVVGVGKQLKAFDGSWQFEKDDTVRSGCIVETSAGEVDFQLDEAWERIKESVVKSLA